MTSFGGFCKCTGCNNLDLPIVLGSIGLESVVSLFSVVSALKCGYEKSPNPVLIPISRLTISSFLNIETSLLEW